MSHKPCRISDFDSCTKKNRHFGRQVIANILGRPETDEDIEIIFQKAYNVSTS